MRKATAVRNNDVARDLIRVPGDKPANAGEAGLQGLIARRSTNDASLASSGRSAWPHPCAIGSLPPSSLLSRCNTCKLRCSARLGDKEWRPNGDNMGKTPIPDLEHDPGDVSDGDCVNFTGDWDEGDIDRALLNGDNGDKTRVINASTPEVVSDSASGGSNRSAMGDSILLSARATAWSVNSVAGNRGVDFVGEHAGEAVRSSVRRNAGRGMSSSAGRKRCLGKDCDNFATGDAVGDVRIGELGSFQ